MRSHLLNAYFGGMSIDQLTAYDYFLETPDTFLTSNRTFGPENLLAEYAHYSAKDRGTDTEKFWLMAQVSF